LACKPPGMMRLDALRMANCGDLKELALKMSKQRAYGCGLRLPVLATH
jgi:hypothetical protein